MRIICVFLILQFFAASSFAEVLKITAYESEEKIPAKENLCHIAEIRNCSTSLYKAFRLVQERRWQKLLEGTKIDAVNLYITGGHYRILEPLSLRWGDSEMRQIPLTVASINGSVMISGAWQPEIFKITDFGHLPKSALGNVYEIYLGRVKYLFQTPPQPRGYAIKTSPLMTEVFYRNQPMSLASWPNNGYGRIKCPNKESCLNRRSFSINSTRNIRDWMREPDLRVSAFFIDDAHDQNLMVAQVDPINNALYLSKDLTSKIVNKTITEGQRMFVENAVAELDSPGEWYVDRFTHKLYFWPPDELTEGDVEVTVSPNLLEIWGSHGITVRGINFEKSRGTAITVKESHDVLIENVTIKNVGTQGIVIEGGKNCGVKRSIIEDTGEGGIYLSGGDYELLDFSHHYAKNNIIRRFNRFVKTFRPGIKLEGVGQIAQGNFITDSSHSAIIFIGNEHRIIDNEISDVLLDSAQSGAIYTEGGYAKRGTLIANNYIHDIKAGYDPFHKAQAMGILIDDEVSGIAVRNNIFARVYLPIYIGGGRDNVISNNLFYRTHKTVKLDPYGLYAHHDSVFDPNDELAKELNIVPYRTIAYAKRYPHLENIKEDDFGLPKYNEVRDNVIVSAGFIPQDPPFEIADSVKSGIEITGTKFFGEDIFEKPAPKDGRKKRKDFVTRLK